MIIMCVCMFSLESSWKYTDSTIFHVYKLKAFFPSIVSWVTHWDMYTFGWASTWEIHLWNDFLCIHCGWKDISIFTCVKYNCKHEIKKLTFFQLVPVGDGVFLLLTIGVSSSGMTSLKTSNSLKILVFVF